MVWLPFACQFFHQLRSFHSPEARHAHRRLAMYFHGGEAAKRYCPMCLHPGTRSGQARPGGSPPATVDVPAGARGVLGLQPTVAHCSWLSAANVLFCLECWTPPLKRLQGAGSESFGASGPPQWLQALPAPLYRPAGAFQGTSERFRAAQPRMRANDTQFAIPLCRPSQAQLATIACSAAVIRHILGNIEQIA